MEIKNTLNRLDPYLNRLETEKGDGRAAAEQATASPAGDTVNIKSPGLKSAIEQAATAAPDMREGKVAAIKASLADGSYNIDSKAIAAKLVEAGNELF